MMTTASLTAPVIAQRRFGAMGSRAHIIVNGGDAEVLLDRAVQRVEQLESHWSRFRDDSDVSRLNRAGGEMCDVDPDTALMVQRAIELWRLTGASVDPLVLGAVVEAGYDRTFEALAELQSRASSQRVVEPWTMIACTDIEVKTGPCRIRLPRGARFDPGGIGKGLAADMIVAELLLGGADGACVNVGGDLRVDGDAPQDGGWTIAIDHPTRNEPVLVVNIGDGAVATSSTVRRTWMIGEERRHHLIDPMTGRPSTTDLVQASVVAGQAWVAEGLAKAVLLRGSQRPFDLLPVGIEAMAIGRDGRVHVSDGFRRFVTGQEIPTTLALDLSAAPTEATS